MCVCVYVCRYPSVGTYGRMHDSTASSAPWLGGVGQAVVPQVRACTHYVMRWYSVTGSGTEGVTRCKFGKSRTPPAIPSFPQARAIRPRQQAGPTRHLGACLCSSVMEVHSGRATLHSAPSAYLRIMHGMDCLDSALACYYYLPPFYLLGMTMTGRGHLERQHRTRPAGD